ncbi:MAG TPA: hypothetical protein VGK30_14925 [Candidatus Binatia bacterium]
MPTDDATTWKRCNTCKRPIAFGASYFTCSVSTCNRKGTDFVFCSVACWDAHVPVLRHRDAWADEQSVPTAEAWEREQRAEAAASPGPRAAAAQAQAAPGGRPAREVLVVVSKLKLYIRQVSGMNTSDDVVEPLSDHLRRVCDEAIAHARADGRKTVMARDLERS